MYLVAEPSGVARNFNWGASSSSPPLSFPICPFPLFSSPFYLIPSLSMSSPLSLPSPALEVEPPEIQLGGLGERCELPQRGLKRSPSWNQIWCILALKTRSGGNDFNYFRLTKLVNLVQFKRMLMSCLKDWGRRGAWTPAPPLCLATPLAEPAT